MPAKPGRPALGTPSANLVLAVERPAPTQLACVARKSWRRLPPAHPVRRSLWPPSSPLAAVVLLARDTPPAAPGIKDLSIDMSQWQPLIEDRAFVPWLVSFFQSCVDSRLLHIFGISEAGKEFLLGCQAV